MSNNLNRNLNSTLAFHSAGNLAEAGRLWQNAKSGKIADVMSPSFISAIQKSSGKERYHDRDATINPCHENASFSMILNWKIRSKIFILQKQHA